MLVLTPAYGRDYTSAAAVRKDWSDQKDFIVASVSDRWCGKPCNLMDLIRARIPNVQIRYAKLTKSVVINVCGLTT